MGLILAALLFTQELPSRALQPHPQGTDAAILTPEGKLLVTNGTPDRAVKVWIADTGKQLYTLGDQARAVAMSEDGTRVAVGGGAITTLWDPASGSRFQSFETGPTSAVAFSSDGKTLTTVSTRAAAQVVTRWNVKSGEKTASFEFAARDTSPRALGAGGGLLALGMPDRTIRIWDVATEKETKKLAGKPTALCFSPDGSRLVSGGDDHAIRVWDVATGQMVKQLTEGYETDPQIAFSRDGDQLAIVADAGVEIWDGKMERRLSICKLPPLGAWIAGAVSFSADGRTLLAGGTLIAKNATKDAKTTGPLYFWKLKR